VQIGAKQPQPNQRPRDIAALRTLDIRIGGTEDADDRIHPVGIGLVPTEDVFGVGPDLAKRDCRAGAFPTIRVTFGAAGLVDHLTPTRETRIDRTWKFRGLGSRNEILEPLIALDETAGRQ
jgi:hypothetical protein